MKKKLSLALALALLASSFAPLAQTNIAYAESEEEFVEVQEQEKAELEQKENELRDLEEALKGTEYEQAVEEGLKAVEKLDSSLNISPYAAAPIYNLNSIGVRIEALTDAIDAMVFSTKELNNKVEKAHRELGFAITKLVIRIADPFASNESIISQVNEVKSIMVRVSAYPELNPTDRATVYFKSKLDKAIWNTRFERDKKVLGVKDFETYNNLNKVITRAVGVQLNPRSTVEQVNNTIIELQEALEFAINK